MTHKRTYTVLVTLINRKADDLLDMDGFADAELFAIALAEQFEKSLPVTAIVDAHEGNWIFDAATSIKHKDS